MGVTVERGDSAPGDTSALGSRRQELRRADVRPGLAALGALLIADVVLLVVEFANRASGLFLPVVLFEAESNIPTWLSVVQLFAAGVCALLLAQVAEGRTRQAWYVVAAAFVLLSVNDGTDLHNRLGDYLANAVYVLLLVPALVTLAALWVVAADLRRRYPLAPALLRGGLVLLVVSVVIDAILVPLTIQGSVLFGAGMIAEEFFELVGGALLLGAVLTALCPSVSLNRGERAVGQDRGG